TRRVTAVSEPQTLPVLPLDDMVALPGMVVPISLDQTDARAAIEAATAASDRSDRAGRSDPQVLLVPRLDGRYASCGALGVVEKIGRFPGGGRGAVVRATGRMRIGAGTTGPGAALWVEATPADEPTP